jgi:hypothetical protein
MIIQMKTKRRWILSILETVGRRRRRPRRGPRLGPSILGPHCDGRRAEGFAMRLKTATRQVSDAAR